MATSSSGIDEFLKTAIHTIQGIYGTTGTTTGTTTSAGTGSFFETPLTKVGKELDGTFNTFSFLLDGKMPNALESDKPYTTVNELNMLFNKSQSLYPPNQFSQMKLQNNVYIENPKAGDWLRFTTDNIEEGLINLKDKNKQDPETTVKDLTTITQKIPVSKKG